MLNNYLLYLVYITNKIQKYFLDQKDYIFCRSGCSKCCSAAQFPYSEIEFQLIMVGFNLLEPSIKSNVLKNIKKINKEKQRHLSKYPNKKFRYRCPFLINNKCSVYQYRGLVCRTFGLMTFIPDSPKTPGIPFCAYEGLNYSNVLDTEKNNISNEKYEQLGLTTEPIAYNVEYKTLIDEDIAKGFGFQFGQVKPLINWFEENNIVK